ncbi:hypothetical protein IAQ61_006096 [Plenodomus lingam]|uniref:uncharacterized protein n=1 Tax=Leptosphaeria maculans TaxID=5022 RepID=UPI00332C0834|nr:hypothetical protein IAQ61_006096 [Plenodomus lingam]
MEHPHSQNSRGCTKPCPEGFNSERNNLYVPSRGQMQSSSQVNRWPQDPNVLSQQGSWVGHATQIGSQNENMEVISGRDEFSNGSYDQQFHGPYGSQYTPVQRLWNTWNSNTNSTCDQETLTPGNASSSGQSSQQAVSRRTERNGNIPSSSERAQYAPSNAQTTSSNYSYSSVSRPAILNTIDQNVQPLDTMQRMLQNDTRAGPYDTVGYIRQDEREYEEYDEEDAVWQQTYGGYVS